MSTRMRASGIYPLFFAIAIVCYVAAVVIAFLLGAVFDVVSEDLSLIPLAIGAAAMTVGMLAETHPR
jgi:H+/gluconate symporter-like permease